ncbi:MAG: MFS transporter [Phycisphaerales bacterium]|nr:MAG: MFS transporter [Phycisphaerales bacterium]
MKNNRTSSRLIAPTLLAASCLIVMCGTAVTAALPAIRAHFASGRDPAEIDLPVKLVLTTPSLAIALGAPVIGIIVDIWGRKGVLILSLLVASIAGASGFVMTSLTAIIAIRVVHGLAVAGIATSATALAADYFRGDRRTRFMGAQAGVMGYGAVAFLLMGGVLADIEWRMPFLMYLSGLLVLAPAMVSLRDLKRLRRPRVKEPLPPSARGAMAVICGLVFFTMVMYMIVPVQLPFHLEQINGATGAQTGLALAFGSLISATVSMVYAQFRKRMGHAAIGLLCLALMGVGMLLMGPARGYVPVYLGLLVSSVGLGLMLPNMNVWVTAVAPGGSRGRALGVMNMFLFLGQFVSPVALQPVAERWGLAATLTGGGAVLLAATILGLPLLRLDRTAAIEDRAVRGTGA